MSAFSLLPTDIALSTLRHRQILSSAAPRPLDRSAGNRRDAIPDPHSLPLFYDRLAQAIMRAQRQHELVALLLLDLDHFRTLNATYGMRSGDYVLVTMADRLVRAVRSIDTVALLDGDAFVIVLAGLPDVSVAGKIAQRLLDTVAAPVVIDDVTIHAGASIGISLSPNNSNDPTTLLSYANIAMYCAKAHARNTYQFYTPALNEAADTRRALAAQLQRALEQDELSVFYQPCVELSTGRVTGVEAVIRWNHPELGWLEPATFLKVAEDRALMQHIDRWVWRTAVAQSRDWQTLGLPPMHVAVNVSADQFFHPDLAAHVGDVLDAIGFAPQTLELEISERIVMLHPERTPRILQQLKALGVGLTVDDVSLHSPIFGHLSAFPLDRLKLAAAAVANLPSLDPGEGVLAALVKLAHTFNLAVTAVGVETTAQRAVLQRIGCDEIQGFLVGRPVPAPICEALYLRRKPRPQMLAPR